MKLSTTALRYQRRKTKTIADTISHKSPGCEKCNNMNEVLALPELLSVQSE
jgi:hypothetical protein